MVQFLPAIQNRAQQIQTQFTKRARIAVPILIGGVVFGVVYFYFKKRSMDKELAKLATDVNVRNAALYVDAVKPPGILMKLLSYSPAGLVLDAADTVKGWFGLSATDQVLAITDRVVDWDATSNSYRIITGGRGLNKDIRKKLGGDYQLFVDRLANNTRARDNKINQEINKVQTQATTDKARAKIMQYPAGKIMVYPKTAVTQIRNWKVGAKTANIQLYSELGHKKLRKGPSAGTYIGMPSGRLLNYDNRNAMIELLTSNGPAWAELNDLKIWTPEAANK